MSGLVACFSGRIASGKTRISRMLADALGWPRTSFGDYLRSLLARGGNHDPSRQALQDLGQILVTRNPDQFCRDVLAEVNFTPGSNLILDGIRHVEILHRIAKLVAPSRVCLIYLAAEDDMLINRMRERGASEVELCRAGLHEVERDLTRSLPQIADALIDSGEPIGTVLSACITVLRQCGADPAALARAADVLNAR
jgi:cytidylate kinase